MKKLNISKESAKKLTNFFNNKTQRYGFEIFDILINDIIKDTNKIFVANDINCKMYSIYINNICIFDGNYSDCYSGCNGQLYEKYNFNNIYGLLYAIEKYIKNDLKHNKIKFKTYMYKHDYV